MARNGYIDNFHDLQEWFMDADVPKFTIAHGDISSRRYLYSQDDPGMNVDEAWNVLEDKLKVFAKNGGTFTVKLPTKNGGNGWSTLFKLPRQEAGVGGIGNSFIGAGGVEAYIAEKISDKLENFELRRKVEDLEAEMHSQGSFLERIVNKITEHPNFDPAAIADKLFTAVSGIVTAMSAKNGASVGLSGFGEAPTGTSPHTGSATAEELSQRIGMALERIANTFPDINMADLLEGLAGYVEKNPDMARMLLINQILKK